MNIADKIWQNSKAYPNKEALIIDNQIVSYQRVYELSSMAVNKFLSFGIKKGDVVALGIEHPVGLISSIVALCKIGAIGMPFKNGWDEEKKIDLLKRHKASYLLNAPKTEAFKNKAVSKLLNLHAEEIFTNLKNNTFNLIDYDILYINSYLKSVYPKAVDSD